MLRVAFLTLYPVETASTRQRIHKNIRLFPSSVRATVFPGITAAAIRRSKSLGDGPLARAVFFLEELARKLIHLYRARRFDVIVVQKGLTAMNLRFLPEVLFRLGPPVVFDFDDAVHLEAPQLFRSRLVRPLFDRRQILNMLPRFDAVVAGNRFLGNVAARENGNVHVIGTPMDVRWYRPREGGSPRSDATRSDATRSDATRSDATRSDATRSDATRSDATRSDGGPVVLGWSGSTTTNHYVNRLAPILRRVGEQVPDLEFRVISNDDRMIDWARFEGVRVSFRKWSLDHLVEDLQELDIGLMPLDDDEWSRSKCGGKILQYMACGIPPVASPVGINRDVIAHGETGFLADSDDAWVEILATLARDSGGRRRMGEAVRKEAIERHSNEVTSPRLSEVLRQVAG